MPSPHSTDQPLTPWRLIQKALFQARLLLYSMPLAITLLAAIIVACLLGTFIPQEDLVPTFQIQDQYGRWYGLMHSAGLFNVFRAPWFIALEGMLFLSIAVGSFRWLRPAYRSAMLIDTLPLRHIQASQGGETNAKPWLESTVEAKELFSTLRQKVRGFGYRVYPEQHAEGETRVYTQKSAHARFGPMLAHIGLLLILGSSVYGAFTSFMARQIVLPGETFRIATAEELKLSMPPQYWLGRIPQGWQVQVDSFEIDYYEEAPTKAKQYTTEFTILDASGKHALEQGYTAVNHPFYYGGVGFYQASFAPTGKLLVSLDGKDLTLDTTLGVAGRRMAIIPVNNNVNLLVFPFTREQDKVHVNHLQVFEQRNGKIVGLPQLADSGLKAEQAVKVSEGKEKVTTILEDEEKEVAGLKIKFNGPQYATGLQMKRSPEYPWMIAGFIIVGLGVVLSLWPHRRLWFVVETLTSDGDEQAHAPDSPTADSPKSRLWLYARTNKAKGSFELEKARLLEAIKLDLDEKAHAQQEQAKKEDDTP